MARYKITVEYDGTRFFGWQEQKDGPSVQTSIAQALAACGNEGQPEVVGAGRTDAGVHALGQVAHFDLPRVWDPDRLQGALNAHLRGQGVAVLACQAAPDDFHARFSAIWRRYSYLISNRRAPLALWENRAAWEPLPLDAEAMHEAAQILVGHHDFSAFRASACQAKSPMKTLDLLTVRRQRDLVIVDAQARSFLHRQVRNMVGTLILVGNGKWTKGDVKAALASLDRTQSGPSAPAAGLYLTGVGYPEK
ncbi:tRNA pseudouridine synthase A [Alphaproteobacteria bacterium]|nr:tRNA pseudouridine synthase A [Alphaproteobacteria bacterium]